MSGDPTVVLIHGAGTGPWIWRRLQDSLTAPSLAVKVPSRHAGATPASCAESIVEALEVAKVERVVLVLHSLAGALAPDLQAHLGTQIASTVFVSAVVPAAGKRFVDAIGFPASLILKILFKRNPHGLKPSEKMLRRELCNDLSEADSTALVEGYEAEWPGLYLTRIGDPREIPDPVYIRLLDDQSLPVKLQNRMIKNLANPKIVELDAGHMAMLSKPDLLSSLIVASTGSA